ncbi:hypothetical protein C9I57_09410 [Trinickia symbiotica]|uniref:Uncharacterized protein n=1 Tax=Trinickia symbiotica TaxID=863227 RepID=A0A2T3XWT2_9BURK|nr:hypothetical protein C9I57_09410 [Trinickia symbiotica]
MAAGTPQLAGAAGRQDAWRTFGFSGHICFMGGMLASAVERGRGEHAGRVGRLHSMRKERPRTLRGRR